MAGVCTLEDLSREIYRWKLSGDRIVFTNGVFDILHVGHVSYLQKAAEMGDRLVVGINSDDSVKRLNKGPERPVNPEVARAAVVAALRCVDAVVLFNEDTPASLIHHFSPDVLVKGGDYDPEEKDQNSKRYIVGSREVLARGGKVAVIPLVEGFSTTAVISKLRR